MVTNKLSKKLQMINNYQYKGIFLPETTEQHSLFSLRSLLTVESGFFNLLNVFSCLVSQFLFKRSSQTARIYVLQCMAKDKWK